VNYGIIHEGGLQYLEIPFQVAKNTQVLILDKVHRLIAYEDYINDDLLPRIAHL